MLEDVTGSNDEQLTTIRELREEMLAGVMDWCNEQRPRGHVGLENLGDLVSFIEGTYKIETGWGSILAYVLLKQLLSDGKLKERGFGPFMLTMINNSIEGRGGNPDEIFTFVMKQACALVKEQK